MTMEMKYLFAIVTQILVISYARCNPCPREQSVDISNGELFPDGSVAHAGILYEQSQWYTAEEDGETKGFGCPCLFRTCLWKCCAENHMYQYNTCNETGLDAVNPFSPQVFKGKDLLNVTAHEHFLYMYGYTCKGKYKVDPNTDYEELYIQQVSIVVRFVLLSLFTRLKIRAISVNDACVYF